MVFPTHVGVFPYHALVAASSERLPHTRGGVSELVYKARRDFMSSPHTWGCFYGLQCKSGKRSVFPTHVGVFPALFYLLHPSLCLPHTRGGVSDRRAVCWTRNRSSPHAWGVSVISALFQRRPPSSPHAWGVSIVQSHNLTGLSSSPRVGVFLVHGEDSTVAPCLPHTRGVFLPPASARAITCLPPHAWGCFRSWPSS